MKNLLSAFTTILIASTGFAQNTVHPLNSPFLFPAFTTGTVYQKGGASLEASLDYNTLTQEMMFDRNGTKMVLDQVDNIDSIVIQNVVLVPAKKVFFEKLTSGNLSLFAQYQSKMVRSEQERNGLKRDMSAEAGVLKKTSDKPDKYDLKWPDSYEAYTQTIYWLNDGSDFIVLNNQAAFIKHYPGRELAINEFIKSNHIKWGKTEDMIKLVNFANQK